jgi:hypothetical protein
MHYEIQHGYKTGKKLTPAQRASGTFAEEPIVLGKVFRRGMKPMMLTEPQFTQHKAPLLRLLLSGSIEIMVVDENKVQTRLDYKAAIGISPRPPPVALAPPLSPAGDGDQPAPASKAESEEQEASEPPSSAPVEAAPVVPEPVIPVPEPETPAVVEVPVPVQAHAPAVQEPVIQKKSKRG